MTAEQPVPDETPDTPWRDLVAAVLAAIDIPHPATVGDQDRFLKVLEQRVQWTAVLLRSLLNTPDPLPEWSWQWHLDEIQRRLARHECDIDAYQHWQKPPTSTDTPATATTAEKGI